MCRDRMISKPHARGHPDDGAGDIGGTRFFDCPLAFLPPNHRRLTTPKSSTLHQKLHRISHRPYRHCSPPWVSPILFTNASTPWLLVATLNLLREMPSLVMPLEVQAHLSQKSTSPAHISSFLTSNWPNSSPQVRKMTKMTKSDDC